MDVPESKRIAEAALFVSGKAMTAQEIGAVLGVASIGHVRSMMDSLMADYLAREGALEIKRVGDTYTLGVRSAYSQKVSSLAGSPDISRASLRILAFISKNQPVMQSLIVKSFGSSSYEHLKELVEKEFISAVKQGRTKKIETTPKFREYFEI